MVRRRVGAVGMADILILVIVADAAQNGMSGEYRSVSEAFVLVGTLIAWNMLIDWLTYRFPRLQAVLDEVDKAYIEPDGKFTVLKKRS